MRMNGMNVFTRVDNSSAEKHGDKHALPGAQLRHIGSFKEGAKCVVREDSLIEGFGSSRNCFPSTDEIIEVIDHLILRKQDHETEVDYDSITEVRLWRLL